MKILDKYVLFKFLITFICCYGLILFIYVLFDLIAKYGEFSDACKDQPFLLLKAIVSYYFINSFVFIDMIFPFLIALAATATVSLMARQNELISLLATGVPPIRTIAPILIGAATISATFTVIRESYFPTQLAEINFAPSEFVNRSDEIAAVSSHDATTKLTIYAEKIIRTEKKLVRPRVTLDRNLNQYGNRIIAGSAIYRPAELGRPAGWLLQDAETPEDLTSKKSLADPNLGETPIVFFPGDSDWLNPNEVFVATTLDPRRVMAGENGALYDSAWELNKMLKTTRNRDEAIELAIRIQTRILRPLGDLLPLALSLPLIFFRSDRKFFATIASGFAASGAYVAAQYACVYFGEKYELTPLGVWPPLLIFAPIAANLFAKLTEKGKGDATARIASRKPI